MAVSATRRAFLLVLYVLTPAFRLVPAWSGALMYIGYGNIRFLVDANRRLSDLDEQATANQSSKDPFLPCVHFPEPHIRVLTAWNLERVVCRFHSSKRNGGDADCVVFLQPVRAGANE